MQLFLKLLVFVLFVISTDQQNFLSAADGLHDRTPENNCVQLFLLRNLEIFLLSFALFIFYDLITTKSRKPEIAELSFVMEKFSSSFFSVFLFIVVFSFSLLFTFYLLLSLFLLFFLSLSLSLSLFLTLLFMLICSSFCSSLLISLKRSLQQLYQSCRSF